MIEFVNEISSKLNISTKQVEAVLNLFAEGATIPFIARYRKDVTGNLDEVQILQIQDEAKFQKEFNERKTFIEKTITEQGKMTEAIQAKLDAADTLAILEDIYLPYKPKRRTKAQIARENGLEPLSAVLLAQENSDLETLAKAYINDNVASIEDALQGARDIIAEQINEDDKVRAGLRKIFEKEGLLISKVISGKEEEAVKYKDYFDYTEPVTKVPSHRGLAVLRGFMEGFLRMSIEPSEQDAIDYINDLYVKGKTAEAEHLLKASKDAWRRLLQPSLESEFRMDLKQRSDEEAINVFAENLRQLLLSSPLGSKRLLAIDPGYRTGCKTVVLDDKGGLKETTVIYIHEQNYKLTEAEKTVRHFVAQYKIEAIAIGDGTAGRETEKFIKGLNLGLPVFLVNEDGASVYSAGEVAREEFPNEDITVRGAVSIGRRLMDPLAELVKIDPKSIGVGQYQHDVNQTRLKDKLDQTVISCVNTVGVNINTASKHLLAYVSGIGGTIAKNIVDYRNEIGKFTSRNQLKKVARLGDKAFEQCAGFLRIPDGDNPLDGSAVHPESYKVVEAIAADLNVPVATLIGNQEKLSEVDVRKFAAYGTHTVSDIVAELKKPGLDPRETASNFEFANIYSIEEVKVGDVLPGIVTNLTKFGAFIDIGVKQDGLVHVSEIANKYISDPSEALKLNQQVKVLVLEVDYARKRIALSIKQADPDFKNKQNAKFSGGQATHKPNRDKPQKPQEKDLGNMNMGDALAALKNKFKK
ncbi:Tex family protein [Polluticaenibacter yanchengensis]|uniref:Tex family protein n=1 Tax=Polluticaenibacter yanchengensis TaxID=3014562 RepID=A0ABT4UIZ6_9BACT|nr:Tex family protein [Chitinophagaceae bacterium LY-5]